MSEEIKDEELQEILVNFIENMDLYHQKTLSDSTNQILQGNIEAKKRFLAYEYQKLRNEIKSKTNRFTCNAIDKKVIEMFFKEENFRRIMEKFKSIDEEQQIVKKLKQDGEQKKEMKPESNNDLGER